LRRLILIFVRLPPENLLTFDTFLTVTLDKAFTITAAKTGSTHHVVICFLEAAAGPAARVSLAFFLRIVDGLFGRGSEL
jgi:hypothetical protein